MTDTGSSHSRFILFLGCCAVLAASVLVVAIFAGTALAAGRGQVIVELRQDSTSETTSAHEFSDVDISGTDSGTKQEYKFQRQREGKNFTYEVANLDPSATHKVELSFVEHDFSSANKRKFNVYIQSVKVLNQLDVYARAGGKDRAYQRTFSTNTDADGRLRVQFRSDESGSKNFATVSTIRVYRGSSSNKAEISAAASRNNMSLPVRHENSSGQNCYEALLGRLGSRLSLNLLPQRLSSRFSTMGTGTGDLADLVLAVYDGSKYRCLPFTDRFPVFESITQKLTMTSIKYSCSSQNTAFPVTVTFRAPFYPQDEQVSTAPFIYVDVRVKNNTGAKRSGSFVFAIPHKLDFGDSGVQEFTAPVSSAVGLQFNNKYNYRDETISSHASKGVIESLALAGGDTPDVDFRGDVESEFTDFDGDSLWEFHSPGGYPDTYNDPKSPIFSFFPRGYSGAVWTITDLAPWASETKHFVLSGYRSGKVLSVKNSSYNDSAFRFRYKQHFSDIEDVVDYAFGNRDSGDDIQGKSEFFDSTISTDSYLKLNSAYKGDVRGLIAYTFQSFLANTWWARSDSGREWFSVWEGTCCRYHGTIDVEYNQAWFYFSYWPELLKQVMDEWILYKKSSNYGKYLSHDMGWGDRATGQAYPHDMAVEENANFILLLYKYYKTTGDKSYMRKMFPTVRQLADFMINCDVNGNGLPDIYTSNTLDQSSQAIQHARDQTYLGVKCMAAYQAIRVMAADVPDQEYWSKCRGQIELINQTLARDLWLSDHFAVCMDGEVESADREAYSIYAGNGLLFLLSGDRVQGVTSDNMSRFRSDMIKATEKTLREYGCTHSSYDSYNEWVSQNLWRDQVAMRTGTPLNGHSPMAMTERYWELEKYFAKYLNGGFWDVVIYPGGEGPFGASVETGGGPFIQTTGSGGSGYQQSLGYYPRGATSLGQIDAVAGLVLDVPGDALYYEPTTSPLRIPVLARADWDNADPSKRVPTVYFPNATSAPTIKNRNLLPGTVARQNVLDISGITEPKHALSPNGDGINETVTVEYELPKYSKVRTGIWDGATKVRSWDTRALKGENDITWDGKTNSGARLGDGIYAASIEAEPHDEAYATRPASRDLWVNSSIPDVASDWYLAEGFTGHNETGGEFEQYVLIQNPNEEPANIEATFMLQGGETLVRQYQVSPKSRFTITVDHILPDAEVSTYIHADRPISVERAMYFNNRKAGHASIGVIHPEETWYLAEGYTDQGFDEYVLIQNPGDETASVKATFMTPNMGNVEKRYSVGPHSRFTIHVDKILPNHMVSTEIESSEPVVVERAQYLNEMRSGTCSIAAASTSRTWYLAEGYTDQGFEEYVLIQNPGESYNDITVTFMESSGANTVKNYELPPASRFTIGVDEILPASEISVKVRAENPVLVERAMYFTERSDGHACIGTPTPDTEWNLAEGYTDQGFETWVLIQNPSDMDASVEVTFMEPGGQNTVKSYLVAPRSRFTIGVDDILPATEFSAKVTSDAPIIVERAVYFSDRSGGTDSIGIRGF